MQGRFACLCPCRWGQSSKNNFSWYAGFLPLEVHCMLQNLEGSEGGRIDIALCTYWWRRVNVRHAGIAFGGEQRDCPTQRVSLQDRRQYGQVRNALSVREMSLRMNSTLVWWQNMWPFSQGKKDLQPFLGRVTIEIRKDIKSRRARVIDCNIASCLSCVYKGGT